MAGVRGRFVRRQSSRSPHVRQFSSRKESIGGPSRPSVRRTQGWSRRLGAPRMRHVPELQYLDDDPISVVCKARSLQERCCCSTRGIGGRRYYAEYAASKECSFARAGRGMQSPFRRLCSLSAGCFCSICLQEDPLQNLWPARGLAYEQNREVVHPIPPTQCISERNVRVVD